MVRQLVLFSTLLVCLISAEAAPANKLLKEDKDEFLLVEIQPGHKDEDLQSASEIPSAASASAESAAVNSTSSSSTESPSQERDQEGTPKKDDAPVIDDESDPTTFHLLHEFMEYNNHNDTDDSGYKLKYSVDDGNLKRFRYEEKTPEGAIVGEFGFHKNGVIRGVRYAAEPGVHPRVLYQALVRFFSL